METFRFRLNCIDNYQATPTDLDPVLRRNTGPSQRQGAPQVPVIRAFGATETGQKVCAHIHGALPYLYLEYSGSLEKDAVTAYILALRASIDHALAATYRRNAYDGKSVYVGHITLVKGVPFYGYNVGYKVFLKVYMLNPMHMTRFADLLHQGAIMNRAFQPYESHLQYLLQWMCDYNLYGCGYIDCAKVQFRGPLPDSDEVDIDLHMWHDASIPDEFIAEEGQYPRQSHCTLEVDICVQDILNRHELQYRPIHHDFLERSSQMPRNPDDKYVPSMAGLWRDETRRRKLRMGLTNPSSSPFPAEVLVSMSADPRNAEKGGWIHEEEYRDLVAELIKEERRQKSDVKFDTFVKPIEGLEALKTAVESIEDLYPENLLTQQLPDDSQEQRLELNQQEVGENIPIVLPENIVQHGEPSVGNAPAGDEAEAENQSDTEEQQSLDPLTVSLLQGSGERTTEDELIDERIAGPGDDGAPTGSRDSNNTRKRHSEPSYEDSVKRQRILAATQGSAKRVSSHDAVSEEGKQHARASQPSLLSQTSIKAQGVGGPTTRSFPVVKNTNAPETVLRLSQSGFSNSQETLKTPRPKNLTVRLSQQSPVTPWTYHKTSSALASSNSPKSRSEAVAITEQLSESFNHRCSAVYYGHLPPSADLVDSTIMHAGLPPVIYQDAYYSDEKDVPDRSREYAGREFKLQSTTLPYLPPFDLTGTSAANIGEHPPVVVDKNKEAAVHRARSQRCNLRHWEISNPPPSFKAVESWLLQERKQFEVVKLASNTEQKQALRPQKTKISKHLSQIDGPTQKNKHGFKFSQKKKSTSVKHETQYMSIMSLEVHVNSRGSLVPDPAEDEIQCIFWTVQGEKNVTTARPRVGILCLSDEHGIAERMAKQVSVEVEYEEDELDLINRIVDIVRQFDPDILTGYEVHNGSWGYLIERARMKFEYNLCDEISRMKSQSHGRFGKEADRWGFTHTSTIRVTGRHMINIWRAMRGELNLLQYTMENVVFHLLHKRIPHYQHSDLTTWYTSNKPRDLSKVLDHFVTRVQLNLDILEANEIVPRTSEQARLLGVDFFSVISRGSQFKVESTMFRIAKPENFILVSPSRKQVGQQNALECLPLVMEPQSAFYSSPLLVLDFQSLYPSVMIAYNFCYSTCLGRIVSWRGRNKMGFMDFKREPQLLELVKDHINIAPNGMMYVKPEMRKSLLAKMLGEILETRVMVKSGMKQDKDDKTLQQLLHNRQLALKLLANVTYGYTSASFSGRLPCSEIADSIVQTGRETLEKAIALIHATEKWGAEVVYGDTDSIFVYLKGRTRDQAFTIGEEIAAAVTAANPRPIKLKFEKVYHPCVLLAKKRYVGFKYESRNQKEPDFDAKGIETVRRDGTPAEQKIEERALKILFRTSDLSQVKRYFQEQCAKIMEGRISLQDFLFAKEVKLGTYSDRGQPPPGALIATKRMLADPRTEPQYGERIPYVVITGAPGARLIDRCVSPETLLQNDHLELDAEYYISKNLIPPLERIFNLVGANVRQWYDEMPKTQRIRNITLPITARQEAGNLLASGGTVSLKKTLESYMKSSACIVCRAKLPPAPPYLPGIDIDALAMLPLCSKCLRRPARSLLALKDRIWKSEVRATEVEMVCRSCSNLAWGGEIKCDSRDCPVFYTRIRERSKLTGLKDGIGGVIEVLEEGNDERPTAEREKSSERIGSERLSW
ncbi:DNA polymeras-like protein zeta catalytic subunit [Cucurbitaria berberidis CBS 394.84]|uniref:DNA polymerase n=1 Tax=Cucurbitaria berberidis CBS 394.84 TaxID=1168544 RepID=A0A9P4GA57_9PLEO|nr:DNA polymeras-like protein zeta catalytic subunit [Cucurbitaria berberidis CBS 394.84]KAF1841784.1 DNA polymeras-like protein zeta catalytic subunit [Cucurbitaria berberidis CBS 394.84]